MNLKQLNNLPAKERWEQADYYCFNDLNPDDWFDDIVGELRAYNSIVGEWFVDLHKGESKFDNILKNNTLDVDCYRLAEPVSISVYYEKEAYQTSIKLDALLPPPEVRLSEAYGVMVDDEYYSDVEEAIEYLASSGYFLTSEDRKKCTEIEVVPVYKLKPIKIKISDDGTDYEILEDEE